MRDLGDKKSRTLIGRLTAVLEKRKPLIVQDDSSMEEIMDTMIRSKHSRTLYVVDPEGQLRGAISLRTLVKHAFARSHEPQIHPRFLMHMITAETARDIMQEKPAFATEEEEVGRVLKRMVESGVEEIPIVDVEKKVVGHVTMVDLIEFLLSPNEE